MLTYVSEVDGIPCRNDEKRNILIRSIGMCKTKNFGISKYQTATRRFLTKKVQVWPQVGYMVDKVALGKISLLVLFLSIVIVIPRWFILIITECFKQIHPCVGWILFYIPNSWHFSVQDIIWI